MAVNFLNNVDLNNNQLLNARVHVDTNAPSGAGKGSIWLNSSTNELNFHNGTNFVSVMDNTTIADTIRTVAVDTTGNGVINSTLDTSESLVFQKGTNVTLTENSGKVTISSTDTQNSAATTIGFFSGSGVISLAANGTISSSAEANVDTDLGKTTHASQITITSSTGDNVVIGEATGSIAGLMSTTHHNKLDGITESADVNRTAAETRTLIGTGNGNLVPATGTVGHFLAHDGVYRAPSYIANTTTGIQMTEATLRTKLASITSNVTIGDATDVQVTIAGNLVVAGTTTTVNSTVVDLNDHNIRLDSGNNTGGVVDGAGITLEGGSGDDATFTYRASTAVKAFELKLGENYESLKVDNLEAASLTVTDYNLATGDIPSLNASKITAGTLGTSRIPNLAASKITSGSFDAARIPSLNTSKLTAGTLGEARGGTGLTSISTLLNSNTTASDVGLGSVTDESKSTMFTDAALTGDPTAPTQTAGDSSTKIATTAFVATATASIGKVTKKLSGVNDQLTYNISHNFGTPHVIVQLLDYGNNGSGATYDVVYTDVKRNNDNSVAIVFGNSTVIGNSQDYLVLITKMPAIS